MNPTDDLAAVVRDEAERCGVDVRELARVLLGWTASDLRQAEVAVAWAARVDALLLAAPGGDESSGSNV